MTDNRYIGVEQEFVSFEPTDLSESVDVRDYFSALKKWEGGYFAKSEGAIRTKSGHAVYTDGCELEVCTPPVRINKGFASRLTDLVITGREKAVHALPSLIHTGLSMHWNLSRNTSENAFYEGMALPFHLFGLTPISGALNMRGKMNQIDGEGRVEFLGDALSNEDQIKATALLLGAYTYAFDAAEGRLPLSLPGSDFVVGIKTPVFLQDGRYSNVNADIQDIANSRQLSAQHYLELFYQWLEPYAKRVGSKKEIDNLSQFVFGNKKLEFDQFKFFTYLHNSHGKRNGTYYPIACPDTSMPHKVITFSGKERVIPLEGRLLGGIVAKKNKNIQNMAWNNLVVNDDGGFETARVDGMDNIYKYAHSLNPDFDELKPSPLLKNMPKKVKIQDLPQKGPKEYVESKDIFVYSPVSVLGKTFGREIAYRFSSTKGRWLMAGSLAAGLLVSSFGAPLYHNYLRVREKTDQVIKHYESLKNIPSIVSPQSTTNVNTNNLEATTNVNHR